MPNKALKKVVKRRKSPAGDEAQLISQMRRLRREIDKTDLELLKILHLRSKSVKKVALLKKALGLPIFQRGRWEEILKERPRWGLEKFQLNERFTRNLFILIHKEAVKLQKKIMGKRGKKK